MWVHDHASLVDDLTGRPSWQGVLTDITERKVAEQALSRRDLILEASSFAAERFLNEPAWADCVDDVLERAGQAAEASRAYVFRNAVRDDGTTEMTQIFEWTADGIDPDDRSRHHVEPPVRGERVRPVGAGLGRGRPHHRAGQRVPRLRARAARTARHRVHPGRSGLRCRRMVGLRRIRPVRAGARLATGGDRGALARREHARRRDRPRARDAHVDGDRGQVPNAHRADPRRHVHGVGGRAGQEALHQPAGGDDPGLRSGRVEP